MAVPVVLLVVAFAAHTAVAAVTKQIQLLPFYVHEDLIDVPAGRDLEYFQNVVDEAIAGANVLLQGEQGPFDSPCAVEIVAAGTPGATLMTFSGADASPPLSASELSSIDFIYDRPELQDIVDRDFGGGSGVFLVDFIERCGTGPFPDPNDLPIGCASTPNCSNDAADDPDLIAVLTLDAAMMGSFATTLAHERGHNSCLLHSDTVDQCEIMRPANAGGCLPVSQCEDYQDGRNACLVIESGKVCEVAVLSTIDTNSCVEATACSNADSLLGGGDALAECHDDATTTAADGTSCVDFGTPGFCSGGTCDSAGSQTDTLLVLSADTDLIAFPSDETSGLEVVDARLTMAAKPGAWTDRGSWDGSAEPQGLAYAPQRGLVYGVVPTVGSDKLIRIDPETGATLSSTTIFGHTGIIALAWDPNADRLLGLESNGVSETVIEIDPDSGNLSTVARLDLKCDGSIGGDNFRGLAFDPINDQLFASSFCGLFLVDCSNAPDNCQMTELEAENRESSNLARAGSGLAYSADTGNVYMIGNQVGIMVTQSPPAMGTFRTTNYNVIRGGTVTKFNTVSVRETIGLDGITVGGVAALPIPEPSVSSMHAVGLAALLGRMWRRRRRRA